VEPFDPQELNASGSLYLTRPTLADYTADRAELLERADRVFGAVERGELRVRIGERFTLADAEAAHTALETRVTTGKVLLVP
jgi:NADPH2:quinone reductase